MAYLQPTGAPPPGSSATPSLLRPAHHHASPKAPARVRALQNAVEAVLNPSQTRSAPPSGTRAAVASWHNANNVSASQPGGAATREIAGISGKITTDAEDLRRLRFRRRQRSSGWVIGADRERAGLPADAGPKDSPDYEWIEPERIARCRWRIGGQVGVHGGKDSGAHFSGVEQCASIHACPVCAAVVRARYAAQIQAAVEQHQAAGGGVVFVTATLRHKRSDALDVTLNAALEGWRRTLSGRPWQRMREEIGWVGTIRTLEVTHNADGGGWHPHVHALLFLDAEPSTAQLRAFDEWFFPRWAARVSTLGAGTPNRAHGLDLQVVRDGKALARYLGKVQDEGAKRTKVGAELARSDFKTGRGTSRNPFELLDADASDGEARRLWIEYVRATKGRQAVTWSDGLRDRFDLDPEATPDEILAETTTGDLRFTVPAQTWDRIQRDPLHLALILEAIETDRYDHAHRITHGIWLDDLLCHPDTGEILHTLTPAITPKSLPLDPASPPAHTPPTDSPTITTHHPLT